MKIGFIGAGKVGFSLGKFLSEGGIPLTGYYDRHRGSAEEAAVFTGAKQYDKMEDLIQESDAIFLTVPDGAISAVFEEIRAFPIAGKQICHCSGAMTVREAFPNLEETGAFGYSIHPLFPISSKETAYRELPGAFFCLEGEGPHLNEWADLLRSLGPQVKLLPSEAKISYHAACAISSNLVCALVQQSLELLSSCGFSEELALKALAPLMRSNLEHVIASGPADALTGAVERNDTATVAKHLSCMERENDRALYRAASLKLCDIAERRHPDRSYEDMKNLLKSEEPKS